MTDAAPPGAPEGAVQGTRRKIALIGLFPYKDLPLGRRFEQAGFEVFWIVKWRSEAVFLLRAGVAPERVLDTSRLDLDAGDADTLAAELAELEFEGAPRMNDIILMDRHLRREPYAFCIRYLGHMNRAITRFLRDNGILLVTTANDTAQQILSVSICKRMGIMAVLGTGVRLPRGRVGFVTRHEADAFLPLRPVTDDDRAQARALLDEFLGGSAKPFFYRTPTGLRDLVAYLPRHLRYWRDVLSWSLHDRGARHNRWTTVDLGRQYVQRHWNLQGLRFAGYRREPGTRPFFMYALHMQPESSIDVLGSYHSDQVALITQLARSTPATHDLYVKIHGGDVGGKDRAFYRTLRRIPGVVLVGPQLDSRALVERADMVFTVSGTIAYECGLLQRPAITFARMYFNALPTVRHCDAPSRLPALIDELRAECARGVDRTDEVVEFVAGLYASSLPTRHHPLFGTLEQHELDTLANGYDLLWERYVAGRGGRAGERAPALAAS